MPRYLITETVEYVIEAESEDRALELFLESDENANYVGTTDRTVELITVPKVPKGR
jgi:hypothetical protein